ncbi:GNAT family N-acetyltransferase [Enterobacteriaceae bacterium G50]|nr:GNAT family N-acetyltransferase [Enterobacteriaceae bacterium G50]
MKAASLIRICQGCCLTKLYLNPANTRKGYGQVTFDNVKKLARARGKSFVWLEVLEQNERACNFYRKQGMTLIKSDYFRTASQQSIIRILRITV